MNILKKEMNNRKAELTSGQVVAAVVLAFTIVVGLFFINLLDLGGQVDWDTCHATIAARGAARYGEVIELGPTSIPLKCKTEKYCVTDRKDLNNKCEGLPQTEDNPVKALTLKKDGSSLKEQYIDFLSEQLYSCNKLLGEGEINFLPTENWDKNYCLICSRIEVDRSYRERVGDISYLELYKHLSKKTAPDGKSYLEHLGMLDAEKSLSAILEGVKKDSDNDVIQRTTLQNWLIPREQFAIISMIHIDGDAEEIISGVGTGILVAGAIIGGVFSGGVTWAAIPVIVSGTAAGIGLGAAAGGFVYMKTSENNDLTKNDESAEYFYMPPTIQSYDDKTLNALGCNSFETAP